MAKLGELGAIITGNTPKTSEPENYSSNDICFVKPSDISDNEITYLTISEYYISEIARNTARIVPPGSILVTCIGIIGKVAINQVECAFNQQINAIVPNGDKCLTEYLAYAVQWGKAKMQEIANAPVVPILNKTQFSEIEVKVPSLSEQRHVATVLNKVCNLIALRKQQLAKLDELVKARFVEMFGGIHNSNKYPYKPIKELTDVISGGTPNRDVNEYWECGTIPWVKTTELQNNLIKKVDEYITEKGLNSSSAKLVPPGTVLIAMYGQGKTRGMTAYLNIEACTNQACACILPSDQINQTFLWKFLILSYDDLRGMAKGGNQPNLNGTIIKNYPILYPPRELQEQFAAFVAQTDKSKAVIQKALDEAQLLFDSLMQKYFG